MQNRTILLTLALLPSLHGCASHATRPTTFEGRRLSDDYLRGRSDAIKSTYWRLQDQQRLQPDSESYRLYDVTIPEHWEDGVLVKPTRRTLRIQE